MAIIRSEFFSLIKNCFMRQTQNLCEIEPLKFFAKNCCPFKFYARVSLLISVFFRKFKLLLILFIITL